YPASALIKVDLPEPFWPSNACTSPRRSSKSTSSRARWPWYVLETLRSSSALLVEGVISIPDGQRSSARCHRGSEVSSQRTVRLRGGASLVDEEHAARCTIGHRGKRFPCKFDRQAGRNRRSRQRTALKAREERTAQPGCAD